MDGKKKISESSRERRRRVRLVQVEGKVPCEDFDLEECQQRSSPGAAAVSSHSTPAEGSKTVRCATQTRREGEARKPLKYKSERKKIVFNTDILMQILLKIQIKI